MFMQPWMSNEEIKLIESELILHYKPIKNEVLK